MNLLIINCQLLIMGVYYVLYNVTKAQIINGYWKADPMCDCNTIKTLLDWGTSDIVVSISDTPGYIYRLRLDQPDVELEQLDALDFYHNVKTAENTEILENWPKNGFRKYTYDGKSILPCNEIVGDNDQESTNDQNILKK